MSIKTCNKDTLYNALDKIKELEKEVQQLKEDKAKLAEKMLNVIGIVSLVSDDAYRCIHKDFIAELKELDK